MNVSHGYDMPQSWVLQPKFETRTQLQGSRREEILGMFKEINPKNHKFLTTIRKDKEKLRLKQGMHPSPGEIILKKNVKFSYLARPENSCLSELISKRKRNEEIGRQRVENSDQGSFNCRGVSLDSLNHGKYIRKLGEKGYFFPVVEENSDCNSLVSKTPSPTRLNEKKTCKLVNIMLKPNEISFENYEYASKYGKNTNLYLPPNFLQEHSHETPRIQPHSESFLKIRFKSHKTIPHIILKKLENPKSFKNYKKISSTPFATTPLKFR